MKIESLKLVCFSPTGTTKAVIQGIARGINRIKTELIDITTPESRKRILQTSEEELLIVGVPVYMGRVPAIASEWLRTIKADNTPAVSVVVYGNREYDNAMLELKDTLARCGCAPIAGAAYIGEHSFSGPETPIAQGRPDASDLDHAKLFGNIIIEKLLSVLSIDEIDYVNIPGSHPYNGETKIWDVDFIQVSNECNDCGTCSHVCPTGAIDSENDKVIDIVKCILCCACIKNCPQNARTIKPGPVKDASVRLNQNCSKRKEPELFL